jgi:hypothetical protein
MSLKQATNNFPFHILKQKCLNSIHICIFIESSIIEKSQKYNELSKENLLTKRNNK